MRISDWSSDVCSSDLLAVADLAASGRAQEGRLADGVGREIIVQQEAFPVLAFQRVDDLLVMARAEGGDDQRLRLAAGEHRRAVGPAENADQIGRANVRTPVTHAHTARRLLLEQ